MLTTHRTRKVKCDEGKPSCRKCVSTGRVCDGYESVFRHHPALPVQGALPSRRHETATSKVPASCTAIRVSASEIELLARNLSTKTLFDVKLDYDAEAKQLIIASLTNSQVRNAILSLRAVRGHLESEGHVAAALVASSDGYEYGVTQYCKAMGELARGLRLPSFESTRSALLCCQVFMGIEQARANFIAMTQHIIRGLAIMHESRARPTLVYQPSRIVSPRYASLPAIDIFIIKFFAAPCKVKDPTASGDADDVLRAALQTPSPGRTQLRNVAPNLRTELTKIAAHAIELLSKASRTTSVAEAQLALADRDALLTALDDWARHADSPAEKLGNSRNESISMGFLRLFHGLMRAILLSAVDSCPDQPVLLRNQHDHIQRIARSIQAKVDAAYRPTSKSAAEEAQVAEVLTPISNPP